MQSSYWGYWLIVMGVAIVGLMISVQGITTNTTQDSYAIREITDAAMLEAVDYAYYRDYNKTDLIYDLERDEHGVVLNNEENLSKGSLYQLDFVLEEGNYVFVSSTPVKETVQ